jgi:prepilin-type N-terminal cleavage/methylation domain-containing protein
MKKINAHSTFLFNCNGFTLVEIIVVLVIMSVMASIAIRRVIALDSTATQKSIECAVAELNSRERLTWSRVRVSASSWINDTQLCAEMNTHLGPDFNWILMVPDGGTLSFRGYQVLLERKPSTESESGSWKLR